MAKQQSKSRERCAWAASADQAYIDYHDTEWGVPVHDDQVLFEFLLLEGAQAGLSWATILKRREGYRRAFASFDPAKVARFTAKRQAKLLEDTGIIRNRLKVQSATTNARAFLNVQESNGSFARYLWGFVDGAPIQNRWKSMREVPAATELSATLSKDLKRLGFKFVGSTIMYAFMQAVGLVNDHVVTCYRHRECERLAKGAKRRLNAGV